MTAAAALRRAGYRAQMVLPGLSIGGAVVATAIYASRPSATPLIVLAGLALTSTSWQGFATIAAMGVAATTGALWPVPCFAAAAVWYLWPGADRRSIARVRIPSVRGSLVGVVTGVVAAVVAFVVQFMPGGSGGFYFDVARPPAVVIALVVIAAAIVNALGEEILWRGVLADAMPRASVWIAYTTQIASFGAAHYFGIPSGLWGMLFAGVYSCIVFAISRRFGAGTAILTHLITDALLFTAMALSAVFAFDIRPG